MTTCRWVMEARWFCVIRFCLVLLAVSVAVGHAQIQLKYDSGQNVAPVYEGWTRNADGTFDMVFGYMNRNHVEEPIVAVGPNNMFEPGDPDRGQPTHFYTRRQQFMFSVRVPADWGNKELVWTLTVNGKIEQAYGSLLTVWDLGTQVQQENRGVAGLYPLEGENDAPSIKAVGDVRRILTVPQALSLSAEVTDDSRPIPRPGRSRRDSRPGPVPQAVVKLDEGVRLGVIWTHHRGPGKVTFEPTRQAVTDGRASTTVKFSEPGEYVIRAYADDGILLSPLDFMVSVNAASSGLKGR